MNARSPFFAATHVTHSNTDFAAEPNARDEIVADFRRALAQELAQTGDHAPAEAVLRSAASACRKALEARWATTQAEDAARAGGRRVHYLSMEFLMGRALGNALAALGLDAPLREELAKHGVSLPDLIEGERDAALGNGGLGRLAACFLDSFAELGLPSFGYGLRYRYGMFAQRIVDGRQVETPDDWMRVGDAWDVARPSLRHPIGFGGRVLVENGQRRWEPAHRLWAEAHDFIVPAHANARVATLRQWQAVAEQPIDFAAFCRGDYAAAAQGPLAADVLNWVLYPDDSTPAGRELRLKQEAFLVSASLQDLIARHLAEGRALTDLGRDNVIHLNDTHPALAPAELMRLLLDEHGLGWDEAWRITREAVSYTNHTLMPEALETWPVALFEALLPRHLELVYEINHRFLAEVRTRHPGDDALLARVSLIDEVGERRVRMAALAIVASHRVNGVSALHSDLMVKTIFADYARLYPERFTNVTNGVTPRRWLQQANPALATVLDRHIGPAWRRDLDALVALRAVADDPALLRDLRAAKRQNKQRLAARIQRDTGVVVDPDSLFDVQAKRVHEYKRQLLNLLHVIARHQAIRARPDADWVPRTVVIAGKAASAYRAAKSVIELAHGVAAAVNDDPLVAGRLKLVFLPNYGVGMAEVLMPAADLSEQISTAGTEASGTGNMKFALNGALTLGTWDGANIEMAEAMGEQHMFVFGLRTDGIALLQAQGYDPARFARENPALQAVLAAIGDGRYAGGDRERFRALLDELLTRDRYFLLADFADYVQVQARVDALYRQPEAWTRQCALNIAAMGGFSSDRTIREYVDRIWRAPAAH